MLFLLVLVFYLQIPDVRTGDDIIDAVVVDSESVGSEGRGSGAKILYGKGSSDRYFSQNKTKDSQVLPMAREYTGLFHRSCLVFMQFDFGADVARDERRRRRGGARASFHRCTVNFSGSDMYSI